MGDFSKHLGFYIQEIARKTTIELNKRLKSYNLCYAQFRVINTLFKKGDLSQKDILKYIIVKPSTLSSSVKKLEKKCFVEKRLDSKDKRIKKIILTENGRKIYKDVWEEILNFEKETTEHIPKDERKMILKYLKDMNKKI